jgi:hypothetical protein
MEMPFRFCRKHPGEAAKPSETLRRLNSGMIARRTLLAPLPLSACTDLPLRKVAATPTASLLSTSFAALHGDGAGGLARFGGGRGTRAWWLVPPMPGREGLAWSGYGVGMAHSPAACPSWRGARIWISPSWRMRADYSPPPVLVLRLWRRAIWSGPQACPELVRAWRPAWSKFRMPSCRASAEASPRSWGRSWAIPAARWCGRTGGSSGLSRPCQMAGARGPAPGSPAWTSAVWPVAGTAGSSSSPSSR